MIIKVEEKAKVWMARYGANKLYTESQKKRQDMSDTELAVIFDECWLSHIEKLVIFASFIEPEKAYPKLSKTHQKYFRENQEHRVFYYKNAEFIAQLLKDKDNIYYLNNIWRKASSDDYPELLFVEFESVKERKKFAKIANLLGQHDQKLGLSLLMDFMKYFPEHLLEKNENEDEDKF
ncbi:hypothetical protein [Spirulina sp. 06S082]|uniref:hypothetical protein n=1 Tax=Spirulina sp. 06S082 TaxID=3110248 RepID=UPI002B214EFA|nr:hypothetical protein [Spirulina sp. 06S082]MEA5472118.1 hypothetical protein [Spirulina sp. 06S082]